MKKLILLIVIFYAIPCLSQKYNTALYDTSKSGINPFIILSFEKVKFKKLNIQDDSFLSINQYRKIFSINYKSFRQRNDLIFFINNNVSFNREFFNKPTSFSYEKYSGSDKQNNFYNDFRTPEEALIFGSLNLLIYMFSDH